MAHTSKRKQQLRRAKRRATTAERAIRILETMPAIEERMQQLTKENYMVKVLLFGIISQNGGSAEVTKGTFEQTAASFARLSVTNTVKEDDEGTHVLTLVEAPEPEPEKAPEPALTIQRVEEPETIDDTHGQHVEEPFPGSSDTTLFEEPNSMSGGFK